MRYFSITHVGKFGVPVEKGYNKRCYGVSSGGGVIVKTGSDKRYNFFLLVEFTM